MSCRAGMWNDVMQMLALVIVLHFRCHAGAGTCPLISQTEPVLEERVVARVPDIDRDLRHRARPRKRELARRTVIAEEHVGHALPFRAGEPGCYEGVAFIERLLYDQRPA